MIVELVIAFVALVVIGYLFSATTEPKVITKTEVVAAPNAEQVIEKQKNLQRIMDHFHHGDEVTNDKVELLLGVSNSTAERYLDELEKQGKLVQVGKTGRGVIYKKV